MNYDRVHTLFSRASEAIVSEDGRVKRRLNNYETIVGRDRDDPFYIPTGAVNDNYGNLNYQNTNLQNTNDQNTDADRQAAKITNLRYAMYATAGVVLLGFIWSLYTFISPAAKSISDDTDYHSYVKTDSATTEIQLERVANLVIRDGDWNKTRIELFLRHWNQIDYDIQETFKQKAWYQHFTYRLNSRFKQERFMGTFAKQPDNAPDHPLMKLALALGVASPKINYALENIESPDDNIYEQLVNEVSTELARVEEQKLETTEDETTIAGSNDPLNAQLVEKLGSDMVQVLPDAEADSTVGQTNPEQDLVVAAVPVANEPVISEQDVALVLEKYASAYENGNFQELSTLFGVNDVTEGDSIVAQLKANYENVFANSNKRSVKFNGLNWRIQGNKAVVNSDYNAELQLNENKGLQTVTANAKLELNKTQDQLRIASFELLNRKVNVVTPEINLSATTPSRVIKPKSPTAAELQDVVTRLVSAYETGDLETFTSLFARDAKTNDRSNLKGIRQDYQDLFSNSNDRQMFIQGMDWKYGDNHAKGSGDLEAIVLSETGESVYSMTGKIQIVAQRIDGKVLITHLYHLERTK